MSDVNTDTENKAPSLEELQKSIAKLEANNAALVSEKRAAEEAKKEEALKAMQLSGDYKALAEQTQKDLDELRKQVSEERKAKDKLEIDSKINQAMSKLSIPEGFLNGARLLIQQKIDNSGSFVFNGDQMSIESGIEAWGKSPEGSPYITANKTVGGMHNVVKPTNAAKSLTSYMTTSQLSKLSTDEQRIYRENVAKGLVKS